MSATGRGAERIESDLYETPAWCVQRFLERYDPPSGVWLDPCAGKGAIIKAANHVRWEIIINSKHEGHDFQWVTAEILPECRESLEDIVGPGQTWIGDFLDVDFRRGIPEPQVIFTNPPYSKAMEFIEASLDHCEGPVVMLLRLNFFGSKKRVKFFQKYCPDIYVLPDRPSFGVSETGSTTDASYYGWFVWPAVPYRGSSTGQITMLDHTPADQRPKPTAVIARKKKG